jgi:hypothetical protein
MDFKGQNGFLNLLMVLKWWRDAIEVASPDWEEGVGDVTWVLEEMMRSGSFPPFIPHYPLGGSC